MLNGTQFPELLFEIKPASLCRCMIKITTVNEEQHVYIQSLHTPEETLKYVKNKYYQTDYHVFEHSCTLILETVCVSSASIFIMSFINNTSLMSQTKLDCSLVSANNP